MQHLLEKLTEVEPDTRLVDVLTAERINAWQDCIKALAAGMAVRTGRNLFKKEMGNFIILDARTTVGSTSATSASHALHCEGKMSGAQPQVVTTFGSIGGVPLTDMTTDGLTVNVSAGTSRYLYAKVTIDGASGNITAVDPHESASLIYPATFTKTLAYLLLCIFDASTTACTAADDLSGSQGYQREFDPFTDPPSYIHKFGALGAL